MPRYRLTNAATELAWTFRALRMRAISQHHTVTVTFTNSHVYTVWTDRNDNDSIDSGEEQTTDVNMRYPGVQLASTQEQVFLQPQQFPVTYHI
jgi:Tfp pilus assembly protein FimT